MWWVVACFVLCLYVQLFNVLATMYLESGQTMGWKDLFRHFVPPVEITIKL
jgi:hypothetical protein